MTDKDPVLLVVLIDTQQLQWRMGGIDQDGTAFPLIASQPDDLSPYRPLSYDEQASFLRHRFCGVLQRGCDRLWGLQKKAQHFIFLIDGDFPDAPPELTVRTAEHLVQWMANPPLSFHRISDCGLQSDWDSEPVTIAGQVDEDISAQLNTGLRELNQCARKAEGWELAPLPKSPS